MNFEKMTFEKNNLKKNTFKDTTFEETAENASNEEDTNHKCSQNHQITWLLNQKVSLSLKFFKTLTTFKVPNFELFRVVHVFHTHFKNVSNERQSFTSSGCSMWVALG